jgi:hypothetical protein
MASDIPGSCWKCVLNGRAFMLPEALEKYPFIDPTDDKVIEAEMRRMEKFSKQERVVRETSETTTIIVAEPKVSHQRFGQTKLADELLTQGLTFEQVVEEIKKRLPLYPAEKIPQLVRIRMSGFKNKKV